MPPAAPVAPGASAPATGVGVGLRKRHFDDILTSPRQPRWVEVLPENHFRFGGKPRAVLDAVRRRMPIVAHGVSLDIGGPDPLNPRYLDDLARFCERWQPPWFTDHLCFSGAFGVQYQDLVPLPFSDAVVDHVAERVRRVRDFIGLPFGLENASYYLQLPGGTMGEGELLRRVLEAADCGLLLDVNNVYVNAMNHGYDPWAFMTALPLERVMQVHLAGHEVLPDGMRFDTHGAPVPDPVWELYGRLVERIGDVPTLIEWDNDVPAWDVLMDEADRAAAVRDAALAQRAAGARGERERAPVDIVRRDTPPLVPSQQAQDPRAVVATVARAIDGSVPVAEAAATLGLDAHGTQRLGFYRDAIHGHATRILHLLYADTRDALGAERFRGHVQAYAAAHPMRDYEWNATAAAFPEHLAEREAPVWAVELAVLERAWFQTYVHPAEIPGDEAPPAPNPTLTFLTSTHRVSAWAGAAADERPATPEPGEEAVLLVRDPVSHRVHRYEATPRRLLALKIVAEGLTEADLVAIGAAPELRAEVLAEARREALIAGRRAT